MNIKEQLERDEKRSKDLYIDSEGNPTIGIGRNLRRGLSEDEIDYLFKNDLNDHLKDLLAALPWAEFIDDARRGALLNMAFNMGVPNLLGFKKMLAAMKAKHWEVASKEALNSLWAKQVGARAIRLSKQILTGVWK